MSERNTELFDTLARVFLRCWVFGFALLLVWATVAYGFVDFVVSLHGPVFGIQRHEVELILYCGMGLLKLLVIVFFFFPWLAIRLVLRGRRS